MNSSYQMIKKLNLSIILFIFSFSLSVSQIDTSYIQITTSSKGIALLSTLKSFQVSFHTDVSEKVTFQNVNLGPGVELRYKKIGLALSLPLLSISKSQLGKPTSIGLGFNLFPSSFFVQGELRYMKGFDDLNTGDFRQNDLMVFADLVGMYAFNGEHFSIRSALKFINIQKRSAGSWLIAVPINSQLFMTDNLRLKQENQLDFELDLYRSIKFGLGGGYAYSKVSGNWSGTMMIIAGPEFRNLFYRNKQTKRLKNKIAISPRARFTGSLIYNKSNLFYGIVGQYTAEAESNDGFNTQVENWYLRLTFGRRFY